MDTKIATTMFDALSQETRLDVFKTLVQVGPSGLPAGEISKKLQTPHNTMSFHLKHLSQAGIVASRREGRSIIYSANFETVHALISFMIKDCCSDTFANIQEDAEGCSIIKLSQCCSKGDTP